MDKGSDPRSNTKVQFQLKHKLQTEFRKQRSYI